MDTLKENILKITEDCFAVQKYISLAELTRYVLMILETIYDKKDFEKQVFPPMVKQLIAQQYPLYYGKHYRGLTKINNSHIVNKLRELPLVPQRSPEWYKLKENSIGASESASLWNDNPYGTKTALLHKKAGEIAKDSSVGSGGTVHMMHGIKYEPVIQMLYCKKHNTMLYEFGSIVHPELPMVSASPDGITPEGVMIEIKAPLSRVINGIPPKYYWYQMQQQLQVCGLDKVDFIECKITEYFNYDLFLTDYDHENDSNLCLAENGLAKGIIAECFSLDPSGNRANSYIYPPELYNTIDRYKQWMDSVKIEIDGSDMTIFNRFIYWKLEVYSECEVWRDDYWWSTAKQDYIDFWNKVEYCRKNGADSIEITKKPIYKRTYNKNKTTCLIDDSDSRPVVTKYDRVVPPKISEWCDEQEPIRNDLVEKCMIDSN